MKTVRSTALVLGLAWAQAAAGQGPGAGNPLVRLSSSIRALTNRVSPAVVEIMVTGYGTVGEDP